MSLQDWWGSAQGRLPPSRGDPKAGIQSVDAKKRKLHSVWREEVELVQLAVGSSEHDQDKGSAPPLHLLDAGVGVTGPRFVAQQRDGPWRPQTRERLAQIGPYLGSEVARAVAGEKAAVELAGGKLAQNLAR